MGEEVIFPHATHALKLSENHLPIARSAFEITQRSHIVDTLRGITIKMYETRRQKDTDSPEVFRAAHPQAEDAPSEAVADTPVQSLGAEEFGDIEIEWMDGRNGDIFLTKPKRPNKDRNSPGAAVSAQKGAIGQFLGTPIPPREQAPKKEKGKWSAGDLEVPIASGREFHLPYNAARPPGNKGRGKSPPINPQQHRSVHLRSRRLSRLTKLLAARKLRLLIRRRRPRPAIHPRHPSWDRTHMKTNTTPGMHITPCENGVGGLTFILAADHPVAFCDYNVF